MKLITILAAITLFGACTKKLGPDETLQKIVRMSLDGTMDREDILGLTTGELNAALSDLDDEEMQKYLKLEGAKRDSFKINLSNCENSKCFLTYTLKYDRMQDGIKTFEVELKKIAEMTKVEERWLLSDVTDVKTYYQSEVPIEP